MSYDTPHEKYLALAEATVGLCQKNVLEVGGCTPPDLLLRYLPHTWTCINLDAKSVSKFNEQTHSLVPKHNYSAIFQDVAEFNQGNSYDLIYSINAFEHVHNLGKAFEKMYRALNQGGYLFTIFGPIWSSDVGHHLSIATEEGKGLSFFDGILAPWEHLVSSPEAIQSKLQLLYDAKTAQRAVNYIYDYPDLNRLCESEYLKIVKDSGFSTVLILRNRKGKPPAINGATSTREFLMILKKSRVDILEKISFFIRFSSSYLKQHYFII